MTGKWKHIFWLNKKGYSVIIKKEMTEMSEERKAKKKILIWYTLLYHQVTPLIKQSPLLNPWLKTEVRLIVCQVHRNSDNQKQFDNKPIFHIYSYDKTGHYFGMQTYDQVSKFYIANPKMAYFEIRLNACSYKSSQCYNFGISQISIKGWPYGL